jgi:hypothetical protein
MHEAVVHQALDGMRSVVDVSELNSSITLHHPSFRDFLLNPRRCVDGGLRAVEAESHRALAERCLRVMANSLTTDISGLRRPGVLFSEVSHFVINDCLPPHVRYACLSWVPHLK